MAMTISKSPWRKRISGSGTLKVSEALANPMNFRTHPPYQRDALATSLNNVGWVQQVVVNERSGHLLDGHLRLSLAQQNGETELPCLYVDLTEDEERLILGEPSTRSRRWRAPIATSSASCWPPSRARTRPCAPCWSASPAKNTLRWR